MPVSILVYSPVPTSLSGEALRTRLPSCREEVRRRLSWASISGTVSSTKEFQAPQMHCPIHLGDS